MESHQGRTPRRLYYQEGEDHFENRRQRRNRLWLWKGYTTYNEGSWLMRQSGSCTNGAEDVKSVF